MQRRAVLKTGAGLAASVGLPRFAWAQGAYKAEYKMSTVVPPAFAWGKGGEIFANLVRERTAGRINIKQYPGASLVQGQQDREFAAMRQGVIDVLCGAPINWAGTVRTLGVFTLPFILPDHRPGTPPPPSRRSSTSTSTSCARPAPSRWRSARRATGRSATASTRSRRRRT